MADTQFDIVIVGGGVVGLATALQLSRRFPSARCAVLEKEDSLGKHQTGHNNCVIHTGIYYRTGSLKARNCVRGARLLKAFCDDNGVEYEDCGKVIVATNPEEVPALEELYRRGVTNGVSGLELIGPERLQEIEPHANGVKAIHSPETAIVDYNAVTEAYAQLFRESGGEVWTGARVKGIRSRPEGLELETERGTVSTRYLVNCAGLHADHIAAMAGVMTNVRLIPFRGEFYALKPAAKGFVRNLIYPVPDPRFPFLGATFGRIKGGVIRSGPNAMVAGSREGYSITDLDPKEAWDHPINAGLLEDGSALLADGAAGDLFLAEQEGLCEVDAEASTERWGRRPREVGERGTGPGDSPRRDSGGRLRDQGNTERGARDQRSVSRGHVLAFHW